MKENLQFIYLYQYYIPQDIFFSDSNWTAMLLSPIHILSGVYPQISVLPYFPFHFLEETTEALLD